MMLYDVTIVGGGPAGMSAALVLGRAKKRVVLVDAGRPRNRVTQGIHGFLTRDGIRPAEFRQTARAELAGYPSVRIAEDTVLSVTGEDGRFIATTAGGDVYESRKVLFAAGMKDLPMELDGLAEVYGRSAFICPYCDGWELRDRPLALITRGAEAMHLTKIVSGWSGELTLCTNGPDGLTEEQRQDLERHGVPVYDAPIRSIESSDGIVRRIVLEDGVSVPCAGIFFKPRLAPGSDLPQALGCRMTETGAVEVDMLGKTSVPGIYSAGDAASPMHQALAAAAAGAMAGAGINGELNEEAWNRSGPIDASGRVGD